jgi:dodecin
MANHTYRLTEIVGTAPEGSDQAIRNGIAKVSSTVRNVDWFEVTQIRGQVGDGEVLHFQVTMKVGFRVDDA